ncbi:MAG: oligosaccharide flippase family protein [Thermoplasmata archaeon]
MSRSSLPMIARRSMLLFLQNVIGAILGAVGLFVVARFTPNPLELLGLIGFGIGFVGIFFVITNLGVPAAHIKRVSQGEPLDRAIGTYVSLNLLQVGLAVGATLLGLFVKTGVLGRGFQTPLELEVIYVMLVYYAAIAVAAIGFSTFHGRLETAKGQTASLTGTVVLVAGTAAVALVGLGAIALSWAFALGAVAAAGVVFLLLRRYPPARPTRPLVRSYLRFAFPLAITLDKTLIQLFWGVEQTGLYFTVQKVVIFLTVINAAVALLLFPSVSRFHARNDLDALRFKTGQVERYLSMIMAPIVAFLLLYPEGVIHVLLSHAFLPGANILRLFVVFTLLVALLVPRQAILQGMDRSDLYGRASLVGMVLILVLFAVLIPTSVLGVPLAGLGPEGAAVSFVVGYAVILGLALAFSHRVVEDRIRGRVGLHLGAALGLAVPFAFLLPPRRAWPGSGSTCSGRRSSSLAGTWPSSPPCASSGRRTSACSWTSWTPGRWRGTSAGS